MNTPNRLYNLKNKECFDPKWNRLYNLENKELNNESLACVYEHSSLSRGWLLFFFKYNQTPYSRTLRIIFLY